jgi:hypothetical protein
MILKGGFNKGWVSISLRIVSLIFKYGFNNI